MLALWIIGKRSRILCGTPQSTCVIRGSAIRLERRSSTGVRRSLLVLKTDSILTSLDFAGLYLHTSYALSELYRPAISPSISDLELQNAFKHLCIGNLINTVEAYLGLNNCTSFARQSWAAMHRALSSALLLGILGEHTRNERARKLIGRFVAVMTDITNSIDPQEISAPVQRGINALRKLKVNEQRPPEFPGDANIVSTDGPDDESVKTDHSAIITPANSDSMFEENDHSPYTVLNTILWGQQ